MNKPSCSKSTQSMGLIVAAFAFALVGCGEAHLTSNVGYYAGEKGEGSARNNDSGSNKNNGDPGQNNGDPGQNNGDPGQNNGDPGQNNGGPGQNNGGPGQNNGGPGQNNGGPGQNNGGPGQNNGGPGQNNGGPGQNNDPGSGSNNDPGSGSNNDPGSGSNNDPGSGSNNDPGSGSNNDPGSGSNNDPGSGSNNDPGSGSNNDPGSGSNNDPGSGSNNQPGASCELTTDLGIFAIPANEGAYQEADVAGYANLTIYSGSIPANRAFKLLMVLEDYWDHDFLDEFDVYEIDEDGTISGCVRGVEVNQQFAFCLKRDDIYDYPRQFSEEADADWEHFCQTYAGLPNLPNICETDFDDEETTADTVEIIKHYAPICPETSCISLQCEYIDDATGEEQEIKAIAVDGSLDMSDVIRGEYFDATLYDTTFSFEGGAHPDVHILTAGLEGAHGEVDTEF